VVNVIRLLDVVKFPSVSTDSDVKDRVLSTKREGFENIDYHVGTTIQKPILRTEKGHMLVKE
jgi:hypothetical protein